MEYVRRLIADANCFRVGGAGDDGSSGRDGERDRVMEGGRKSERQRRERERERER